MAEPQSSDAMKNLVIFLIQLAVLGLIVAFAWYYLVDLPLQAALHPPANSIVYTS
jgi:hypothetical protein